MSTLATRARSVQAADADRQGPDQHDLRGRRRSSFAVLLPFFYDSGSGFINDATVALVYVVMALGLNIVVGFAGLLDLGYVAFYAIGAYTMGWLGSSWFSGSTTSTSASPSSSRASPASTSTG